jgi:hypothetical protein
MKTPNDFLPPKSTAPSPVRIIAYHWDGHTLSGLLVLDPDDVVPGVHRPAATAVLSVDSWITPEQAISVLKEIIELIASDGLVPAGAMKMAEETARKLEEEGDDE